jgi:hypothetical protein
MAQAHGKDSVLLIHDGTSLRNITPYTKNIDVNRSQDANDTTTKGAEGKTYRPGLTDGELRITGLWDDTVSVGPRVLFKTLLGLEAATSFEWGPEGAGAGQEKDSGACCITQYDESSPVDNMVAFTATLKISGDVTSGVWP